MDGPTAGCLRHPVMIGLSLGLVRGWLRSTLRAMSNETRRRLLDAAVELLVTEGSSGITTGRLTEQAGVVQSAFYNHFRSVGECKAAALREVEQQILALSGGVILEFQAEGSTAIEDAERVLLDVFAVAAERPALFRLLTHRRHEPEIEAVVQQLLASVRDDISAAINAETSRLKHLPAADIETTAALMTSLSIACLEQVLDGSSPDHVAIVGARIMMTGVFGAAGVEI